MAYAPLGSTGKSDTGVKGEDEMRCSGQEDGQTGKLAGSRAAPKRFPIPDSFSYVT